MIASLALPLAGKIMAPFFFAAAAAGIYFAIKYFKK